VNPLKRLYSTARWRRVRKAQLQREPLCRMCNQMGRVVAATIADHIEPHRGDVVAFWCNALQSLCAPCHSGAKQQLEKGGTLRGCDKDGNPFGRADW
jgi:5-methylcytosine-specific restriction enzyme A